MSPGEVLRDWINGHGKTVQEAAKLMGVSRATLNRLLSGVGRIAPKLAVQLEGMGWSSAEMWLRLQLTHDLAACETGRMSIRQRWAHSGTGRNAISVSC